MGKNQEHNNYKWFPLDNAAKLYPVIMKRSYVSTFRLSADLKDLVDPQILQQALESIIDRFPYYKVKLRKGFFWYYFESNENIPRVEKDIQYPCEHFKRKENNGYLIRTRYYERRIAVEFFHGLTDAAGAVVFLKTLLAQYLFFKKGIKVSNEKGVLDIKQTALPEEYEDSYNKHAEFKIVKRPLRQKAYKIKGTSEIPNKFHIISSVIPLSALKSKAGEYKVSLTEYLVAVFIYAIYEDSRNSFFGYRQRPIQISVPVNMRNFYPSKTMRNFSLYTSPGIEPAYGEYTFDEIVKNVHHYMRYQLNSKYMNALMCANVGSEKNFLIKLTPLFVKNIFMMAGYKKFGIHKFTATFSNMGIVEVPGDMQNEVERFDLVVGPCRYNPINIGLLSYEDNIYLSISDTIKEKNIQHYFFRHLVKSRIPVKIETNEVW